MVQMISSKKNLNIFLFSCSSQLEERYAVAAETRNNLVAASQNIQGAQRYLSNIQFPYCAPPEVDTLNKVCNSKK